MARFKQNDHDRPVYSIVVPVYNSADTLKDLVIRLKQVFEGVILKKFEIIFIDDNSDRPATWPMLESLCREYPFITAVRLMRNYGKPGAVVCGLELINGDWAITIDDDLQQKPEDIPKLVDYQDHDVVVGAFKTNRHSALKRVTSWIKNHFDRIILGVPCKMSPLKLFKAEVARGMLQMRTANPFIPALMANVTQDFVSVEVAHEISQHGKSRYNFVRRIRQFTNLLIGNSSLVLRAFGLLGSIVSLSGFIFAIYIIIRKLSGFDVQPGWSSLIVINLFFSGFILVALGINGEYLIRILDDSGRRPPYVIRRIVKGAERNANHGKA